MLLSILFYEGSLHSTLHLWKEMREGERVERENKTLLAFTVSRWLVGRVSPTYSTSLHVRHLFVARATGDLSSFLPSFLFLGGLGQFQLTRNCKSQLLCTCFRSLFLPHATCVAGDESIRNQFRMNHNSHF